MAAQTKSISTSVISGKHGNVTILLFAPSDTGKGTGERCLVVGKSVSKYG
jgi:hypothetical protein